MVKATAVTQAEVDVREADELVERELNEAIAKIKDQQVMMSRLTLWLMRYVWPRLSKEERGEIKTIIPDEMEADIRIALTKLP